MIREILLSLCMTMCVGTLVAQNELQEINAIKSNMNFLYATGTSTKSGEEASNNARDLLNLEIEQWLKENSKEDIAGYIAKSRESQSQIQTKRGNLYRVFAFVKKKDILPYYKEEDVMVVGYVKPKEIDVSINTPDKKPVQDSPKPEIPSYTPTSRERVLMNISTFNKLNEYINSGREDGSVTDVGKYSNMPQTGLVYAFIHNKQGEIPACLKVTDGKALNLNTGKDDLISNYKGCGAIWIKLKNE